jgi:hypothetical protein
LVWLSGLANTPWFIFLVFLEGNYWSPKRLGGFLLGIEDVLISFLVGAMSWLLAAWPHRYRLGRNRLSGSSWRRYPLYTCPVAGVYLLLVWSRLGPMTALIVTLLLAWGVLLLVRPKLWPLSLTGGLLFPLGYYLSVKLLYWIWPDSVQQWNLTVYWGKLIAGVPVGELMWAICFGASWPLLVSCLFQVKVLEKGLGIPTVQTSIAQKNRPEVLVCEKNQGQVRRESTRGDTPG